LVLGFLTGPTPAFLAAFLALAFELIFDRSHPIENERVDLFDDVEHTELMLQVLPVTLQTVFVEWREEHSVILTSHRDLSIIGEDSSITLLERAPYGTG
jgi:hypothetical protein